MNGCEAEFVQGISARVDEILERCSACGRCVEVCPTAGPAGIDRSAHSALLCLDVLDRICTAYKVFGGPANCCGILQLRAGDAGGAARIGGNTVAAFAATGAPRVLTWCPTCNIQFGETLMPTMGAGFA